MEMAKKTRVVRDFVRTGVIPRTHAAAKKRGYKKAKFNYADLSDEHKAHFVQLEGGSTGSVCGVAPSPDPKYWLVCYKNDNGECNWVKVPKGELTQTHG
jgi:hypothetical protein